MGCECLCRSPSFSKLSPMVEQVLELRNPRVRHEALRIRMKIRRLVNSIVMKEKSKDFQQSIHRC